MSDDHDENDDKPNIGDLIPQIIPSLNDSLENKGFVFLLNRENDEKHSVEYCTKLVLDLATSPKVDSISVIINCDGGEVNDFLGLHDMLLLARNYYDKPVTTMICGMAASGAAIVTQAGSTRLATKNSFIMLHEVITGLVGTSSEMAEEVSQAKVFEKVVFKIWADAMGISLKELKELLEKRDVYYSAKEAKRLGLIDKVV